jgi:hypothetical protein
MEVGDDLGGSDLVELVADDLGVADQPVGDTDHHLRGAYRPG